MGDECAAWAAVHEQQCRRPMSLVDVNDEPQQPSCFKHSIAQRRQEREGAEKEGSASLRGMLPKSGGGNPAICSMAAPVCAGAAVQHQGGKIEGSCSVPRREPRGTSTGKKSVNALDLGGRRRRRNGILGFVSACVVQISARRMLSADVSFLLSAGAAFMHCTHLLCPELLLLRVARDVASGHARIPHSPF
eukprot:1159087-Pelagomonas_calceolata.AAC.2